MSSTLRFRSRIDPVVAVVLTAPIVVAAYLLYAGRRDGVGLPVAGLVALVASAALIGWIVFDTSYTVTDTELLIRGGPQRSRIPLASIRRVRRSHTLIAAPALSMRRLELEHGTYGLAVISPEREAEFFALLRERVPGVELPGPG